MEFVAGFVFGVGLWVVFDRLGKLESLKKMFKYKK